jgi:hypothetical protein
MHTRVNGETDEQIEMRMEAHRETKAYKLTRKLLEREVMARMRIDHNAERTLRALVMEKLLLDEKVNTLAGSIAKEATGTNW